MDRYAELAHRLGEDRVQRDVRLAPYTTFQIGGPADWYYEARTKDELAVAVQAGRELGIPYFLLGRGANVLIGDHGFRGLVIRNDARGIEFLDDGLVRVASGELVFHDLIQATVVRGLGGLHHFVGIPSTVGGAVWQNLHFLSPPPERERTVFIEEVLESCEILTEEGEIRQVGTDYFNFGYDYSILHDRDDVVLSTDFRLQQQSPEQLRHTMRENLQWRDDKHPDLWLYPCIGSIFKKIDGIGAGRLVDGCGLKGHSIGNAGIFHKHANIIVNLGGATARDVVDLIELARTTVLQETGYELETEITAVGEF